MKLKASVTYKDAIALYEITFDKQGIYTASLCDYKGSVHRLPPARITLTQGIRHWIGSSDDPTLNNGLGSAIDQFLSGDAAVEQKAIGSK